MGTSYGAGAFTGTYTGTLPTVSYTGIGDVAVTADVQAVKVSYKSEATSLDLNDGNGKPVGFVKIRGMRTLDLDLVVRVRTTPNVAETIIALKPPKDFQAITLANFISDADTFLNGAWVYKSGASLDLSDEGEASIKFQLMQYYDSTGTVIAASTLLTAVS